ncbi:MAG TPA: glutaredoxin domain-containing protein [Burkholderiales bacterium]|nr:glutaredoxin domain-containing protein [Burkholderiales bacterium]
MGGWQTFGGVLALLAAGAAAAQGIHRWTDERGRVHYGNEPPRDARAMQVPERVSTYAGPVDVRRVPGVVKAPAAAAAQPLVMYATSWCPVCAKARAYFRKHGIAYEEHDVEKSPEAKAEFTRLGGKGVPLIVHGRAAMSGFSENGFEALLARSGR